MRTGRANRTRAHLTRLELRVHVPGEQDQGAQCHPEQRRAHRSPVPVATQREPRVHRLEHSHHHTERHQSDSQGRAPPMVMVPRHGLRMCNIFAGGRSPVSRHPPVAASRTSHEGAGAEAAEAIEAGVPAWRDAGGS